MVATSGDKGKQEVGWGRIMLLVIIPEASLLEGGGGGSLPHPHALLLEPGTHVHPLPLHGGQTTHTGRTWDEKVAWLLLLLNPSQVPCPSGAP